MLEGQYDPYWKCKVAGVGTCDRRQTALLRVS